MAYLWARDLPPLVDIAVQSLIAAANFRSKKKNASAPHNPNLNGKIKAKNPAQVRAPTRNQGNPTSRSSISSLFITWGSSCICTALDFVWVFFELQKTSTVPKNKKIKTVHVVTLVP